MTSRKIRIYLRAYDHRLLDHSAAEIVETVRMSGCKMIGPMPLPVKRERFCVLRGPHKHKKSREIFELRTHKRLLDIVDPTAKTMDSLMKIDLPSGIDIEIKL